VTSLAIAFLLAAATAAADDAPACRAAASGGARYTVCEVNPATDEIRLFLNDEAGAPYGDFAPLAAALAAKGETLVFAMNAGMYHEDRSPVGLYTENGEQKHNASTRDGPGNFHLKPNGVFWISDSKDGAVAAYVTETGVFLEGAHFIREATQSGPMLVIDGAIHPKFLVDATSRKRRNGVGVREDGAVVFAISDTRVTFHEFATYFRDTLNCPNALYLDGTISRLYAPALGRDDGGAMMGPIVGVVGTGE
jgi:uncharacterized protein YigE (DUF2233 family)